MFVQRAISGSASSGCEDQSSQDEAVKSKVDTIIIKDPVRKLQGMISSFPPIVFGVKHFVSFFPLKFGFLSWKWLVNSKVRLLFFFLDGCFN